MVFWEVIAPVKEFLTQRAFGVFGLIAPALLQLWDNVFNDVFKGSRSDVVRQVETIDISFILNLDQFLGNGCTGSDQDGAESTNTDPFGKFANGPFFAVTGSLAEGFGSRLDGIGFDVTNRSIEVVFGKVDSHPPGHQCQRTFDVGVLCQIAVFLLRLVICCTGDDGLIAKTLMSWGSRPASTNA